MHNPPGGSAHPPDDAHGVRLHHAVFRHDIRPLLPRLKLPVLCMASESDPVSQYLDESAALVPGAKKVLIPRAGGLEAKAAAIEAFLNA